MSTLDIAKQHFNNGQFVLSVGAIDEYLYNEKLGTMLELRVHNRILSE